MELMSLAGRRLLFGVLLAIALVGCDLGTKELAVRELRGAAPVPVVGEWLSLRYVENTDIGFSLLSWLDPATRFWLLVSIVPAVMVGLGVWWWRRRHEARLLEHLALGSVWAGAAGNYVDRLTRGHVVDFISVPHYPVFNVADIAVAVGAAVLLWGGGSGQSSTSNTGSADSRSPEVP